MRVYFRVCVCCQSGKPGPLRIQEKEGKVVDVDVVVVVVVVALAAISENEWTKHTTGGKSLRVVPSGPGALRTGLFIHISIIYFH